MDFRLLGPVEVFDGRRPVNVGGGKQTGLLVRLLVDANRTVSADRLVEDLWDGHPPPSATPTLHTYVAGLRRALQPGTGPAQHVLKTRRRGYLLEVAPDSVDVQRFEGLLRRGQRALEVEDWDTAAGDLADALALWRGPALADVGLAFAQAEATRLNELRLEALERRVTADLALGRHIELVAELDALVAAEPLRESLHGCLMLALYRCGRQADALARYHALRRTLADELGIDPAPELQRLHEAMLLQKSELDWTPPIPARAVLGRAPPGEPPRPDRSAPPHNLPIELTSFVGRRAEVAEVAADLAAARLVTLVGPGGVGKSRLALRVARQVLERFPGGVRLVELAPLDDPALPAARLLAMLDRGGDPAGDTAQALVEEIGSAELLVVLDNCEHLAEACAELVTTLLRRCPGVRVLATSREPLHAPGERLRRVSSLPVPGEDWRDDPEAVERSDAARLFIDRASTMDPQFTLDPAHVEALAQICRRLDGIPLALELAAARARVMALPDIAARLDDRFGLLGASTRTVSRHRTLRATMDWSYQLLSEAERALIAPLSVFAGSFDLAAAEHVGEAPAEAGTILGALAGLVDKSLVVSEERAGRRRYRLLETVRQYALGKLEEAGGVESARARHARFYLAVAERAEARLYGSGLTGLLRELADDHENFRVALDCFAAAGDPAQLRLAAALWRYCYLRGHYRDGRAWLGRALEGRREAAPAPVVARGTHGAGALAFYQCDYEQARRLCLDALGRYRLIGDRSGEGAVLTLLGSIARERGAYADAIGLHEQSLRIAEQFGDGWGVAHGLQMCGFAAWLSGDYDRARDLSTRSLRRCRTLGDEERTAWALIDLGAIAHYTGEQAAATERLGESLALSRGLSFTEGIAWSLNLLGLVALARGDDGAAVTTLAESLRLHTEVGDRWRAASVLEGLAAGAAGIDQAFAARSLGAAEAVRAAIGAPVPPCERALLDRTVTLLRQRLGGARLDELRADGAHGSLQAATRQALAVGRGRQGSVTA